MSEKEFKELFQLSSAILAKKDPALFYICKSFPIFYADVKMGDRLASLINNKFIVFYKDILEVTDDEKQLIVEILATWIHEVVHAIFRHINRMKNIEENEKEFAEKEPDVFKKLVNIAFDIKTDLYVKEVFFKWKNVNMPTTLIKADLSIDVESSSAEEIYYHLKNNVKIIELPIGCDLIPCSDLTIKDNIIFVKNKKAVCLNEGSVKIRESKDDNELKQSITEILITAKNVGNLPGFLERYVTDLLKPKINWRVKLRQSVISYLFKSYISTYVKPSRKFNEAPGNRKISTARVWCFIDASGSISSKEFNQFMSEVAAISKYGSEVIAIVWDTEIKDIVKVKKPSDVRVKFKGGGGTTFAPVISQFVSKIKKYDVMIVLTDSEWFDTEKAVKYILTIPAKKILVTTTSKTIEGFNEVIFLNV